MNEKTEIIPDEGKWATTPENSKVIPIKFNKEVRHITLEEASTLSQKGLKYDAIEKHWSRLLAMAKEDSTSVQEFLDALEMGRTEKRIEELTKECGGNSEMAQKIINLERGGEKVLKGAEELSEFFPDVTVEDLPQEVVEHASQLNSNLLDEYLRYKAREAAELLRQERQRKENLISSVGSQKTSGVYRTPENEQFIRGLWNK